MKYHTLCRVENPLLLCVHQELYKHLDREVGVDVNVAAGTMCSVGILLETLSEEQRS